MSLLDTASLIVTPNGYKEGKLYSVIPSDGSGDMSVTRATTATRVNSAGLVELVPYNLAQYSEQFDNAAWTNIDATINANTTTAPNGTLTADKINETSVSGFFIAGGSSTLNGSTEYTFSFYAKSAERTIARALFGTGSFNAKYAYFNLSTGVTTTNATNSTIESVGNGWYRCTITDTTLSSPAPNSVFGWIGPSNNMTNAYNTYTGTTGSGIYIWGAQLNEGTIKPYQKTETRLNIPRLDYSNGTCPSLLVEPQRTNLLTYSSSFDNAAWTKASATITANSVTSPSGTQDADTLSITSSFGQVAQLLTKSSSAITYTLSCYIQAGTSSLATIALSDYTTGQAYATIDLTNETITPNAGTWTGASATIENVENGWYLCTLTSTSPANGYVFPKVQNDGGTGTTIYIWGAQLEAGSYATSYIPTTSASVTRNADVISKTGISSLIGQTEGTLFVDTYIDNIAAQTNDPVLLYVKGTTAEAYIEVNHTGGVYGVFYNGSTSTGFILANIGLTNGRHKMAFGYKDNDFVLYVDGVQVGTDTSGAVSGSLTEFGLQYYQNFYVGTQDINSAALWKTRLTNTQLAQLTTI